MKLPATTQPLNRRHKTAPPPAGTGHTGHAGQAGQADPTGLVSAIVENVARLLPEQAPLTYFVHHNTLHAFESLPFQEAVTQAAEVLGTQPFQSERQFAEHLRSGRIQTDDLRAVLAPLDEADGDAEILPGGPARREFRLRRLTALFEIPRGTALRWTLDETDALHGFHPLVSEDRRADLIRQARRRSAVAVPDDSPPGGGDAGPLRPGRGRRGAEDAGASTGSAEFGEPTRLEGQQEPERTSSAPLATDSRNGPTGQLLAELWTALESQHPPARPAAAPARRRDQILRRFAVDTDELVHPVLIRLCAAFLDQGLALWPMPDRADGLLVAFRQLFGLERRAPGRVWRGLDALLRTQQREGWSAHRTVLWALEALGLPESRWPAAIQASLLSLRGWAGMVRQFELRPDRVPVRPSPVRLVDYLAVQLTLEAVATGHALTTRLGAGATPADLGPLDGTEPAGQGVGGGDLSLVYEAFVLAQLMDVDIERLTEPRWARAWLDAAAGLDEPRRGGCSTSPMSGATAPPCWTRCARTAGAQPANRRRRPSTSTRCSAWTSARSHCVGTWRSAIPPPGPTARQASSGWRWRTKASTTCAPGPCARSPSRPGTWWSSGPSTRSSTPRTAAPSGATGWWATPCPPPGAPSAAAPR